MAVKYIPSLKKAVLPSDVASEVEEYKGTEILEHGLGNNKKYYILIRLEDNVEDSYLEIIQYDLTEVPEEAVVEFSEMLEDLKKLAEES